MKDGEGMCLQYPSCRGNDMLVFHFQRGVLSCGHQDMFFQHDRKVKQAVGQYGLMEYTKTKRSDL